MEGGVPRVEGPDSEPKNFHLSKQAAEKVVESLSQTPKRILLCCQLTEEDL